MTHQDDDETLLERWRERRDQSAFADLAARYTPLVFDVAARVLGDRAAAEDLVQEALLDLALEPTDKPARVGVAAWLARFAICRGRNRRSSEISRSRRQRVVGSRKREEVMPDGRLERDDQLEHALELAEPEERAILAMRFLHGWEYDRIAAALSVSEGAARVRVHRSLAAVRSRVSVSSRKGRDVVAGLAALPLLAPPPGMLERVVAGALEGAAQVSAAASSASASSSTSSAAASGSGGSTTTGSLARAVRTALQVAGASLCLMAAAVATTAPPTVTTGTGRAPADGVRTATRPLDGRSAGWGTGRPVAWESAAGTPRPRGWDDGVLGRIGRGERELVPTPETSVGIGAQVPPGPVPTPSVGRPQDEVAGRDATPGLRDDRSAPERERIEEHTGASRLTERVACAARCFPASSDDERAGALVGSSAEVETGDVKTAAAIPAAASPASSASPRLSGRPLSLLLPEDRELVEEAAELVRAVVAEDLEALVGRPRRLRRQMRLLSREYRLRRRTILQAVAAGDEEAVVEAAALMSRVSDVRAALGSLLDLVAAGPDDDSEPVWPDGLDPAAVLEDVIAVLGGTDPAPLPDGVGGDGPASAGESLDGALPDGAW